MSGRRVDAVMQAPPHMKGGLVIIRNYCRFAPVLVSPCVSPTSFYYYNVSRATCTLVENGCTTSDNNFNTKETCINTCVVRKN